MLFRIRLLASVLVWGILLAGFSGVAKAEESGSVMNTPAMQSLIGTPTMQKAIAAARKGDGPAAAAYFHAAARQGNPLAQATLGRMYFEGKGVPRNYAESLKWLKLVLARNQEPTLSIATSTLKDISAALRNSGSREDRMAGATAGILPLLQDPYLRQWLRNAARNTDQTTILTCIGITCF